MADIIVEKNGRVTGLRFNRPGKKNAITSAMYTMLADALAEAAGDNAVRVVTIAGSGGIFSAGNDIQDFLANLPSGTDLPVFHFLHAISAFPKPIVAAVEGNAIGIGATMLLHCDLVLAAPGAMLSFPFVDLALVPEAASSLLLPRLIGPQRTAKHLLLGDPVDAWTALAYGIVTELVEGSLEERLREIAERLAKKPPEALRLAKALIREEGEPVAARILREGELFAQRLQSAEAMEAFRAFVEKRAPDFG